MTRYVTRRPAPRAWCDTDDLWTPWDDSAPSVTVYEREDKTPFTGLYDASGDPLHRDERNPVGFIW